MAVTSTRLAPFDAREIDLVEEESVQERALPGGDHEAEFDRLYTEFHLRVVGLVRKFITDEDQIDDLVQETFFRAYNAGIHVEYVDEGDDGRSPWPWLAAVARNLSLDNIRKRKAALEEEIDDDLLEISESIDDPEVRFLASRRYEGIVEALHEMCPRQSRLLILRHVQGVDYVDLARDEGISVDALKSVIARARRTFKDTYASIAEHGGLGVVAGGLIARSRDRLRSLRDRLLGVPDALNAAAAGSPAISNTVMSLTVLGVAGIVGAVVAGSPSEPAPEPTPIVSDTPAVTEVAAAPEPVVVTVDPEPASVGVVAPDPDSDPEPTPEPEHSSDSLESEGEPFTPNTNVTVEDDEAAAEAEDYTVTVDGSIKKAERNGGTQYEHDKLTVEGENEDGEKEPIVETSGSAWCPPEDERTALGSLVCPVLDTAAEDE